MLAFCVGDVHVNTFETILVRWVIISPYRVHLSYPKVTKPLRKRPNASSHSKRLLNFGTLRHISITGVSGVYYQVDKYKLVFLRNSAGRELTAAGFFLPVLIAYASKVRHD